MLSALSSRLVLAHIMPDMAVIVIVFLALRREPVPLVMAALALGYIVGRQALAPSGLHETALVVCAVGVYLVAGNIAGSGGLFFALAAGMAVMFYHVVLFLLIYWQRGSAGFASWAAAILLPSAFCTALAALICHPFMMWLEKRLTQDKREGLLWR